MKTNHEKSQKLQSALLNVADLIGTPKTDKNGFPCGLNMLEDESRCRERASHIGKGLFITQIIGGYNSGKSTIINALIKNDVLPSLIRPATAILTLLQYGTENRCHVHYKPTQNDNGELITGKVEEMSVEEFKEKFTYTNEDDKEFADLGYVKRFSDVDHAVVTVNSALLKNSNRIVDSPGLRNNAADNALAIEMAKKANAVIYVGTAEKAGFDMEDKEYFSQYFDVCSNNVFFIVNKFDICGTEQDKNHVKTRVNLDLMPFFTTEEGVVNDKLMQKRVFFVSALQAVNSFKGERINEFGQMERLSDEYCQQLYDNSGFGPLVDELETYLNTDAKNQDMYSEGIKLMSAIEERAVSRVEDDKMLFQNKSLHSQIEQGKIQETIDNIGVMISSTEKTVNASTVKIQAQFSDVIKKAVESVDETWEQDIKAIAEETDFSFSKYLKLTCKQLNFFKDKDTRSREVEEMLEPFSEAVANHISKVIEKSIKANTPVIEKVVAEAETEIGTSAEGIRNLFSKLPSSIGSKQAKLKAPSVSIAQQLISLYFGDFSEMASGAGKGKRSWLSFIQRTITNTLWQWAVVVFLSGPLALPLIVAIELWQMKNSKDSVANDALNKAKSSIMSAIKENIDRIIADKNLMLAQEMEYVKNTLCKANRLKLEEEKARLDKLQKDIADMSFNYEAEHTRCCSILNRLHQEIEDTKEFILIS